MVTIAALNVVKGDKEIYIEDTTPEERDELANTVLDLLKKGFALFLIRGEESHQIKGYDKESHNWIILSDSKTSPKKAKKEKVSAKDTTVTAVGATAGG